MKIFSKGTEVWLASEFTDSNGLPSLSSNVSLFDGSVEEGGSGSFSNGLKVGAGGDGAGAGAVSGTGVASEGGLPNRWKGIVGKWIKGRSRGRRSRCWGGIGHSCSFGSGSLNRRKGIVGKWIKGRSRGRRSRCWGGIGHSCSLEAGVSSTGGRDRWQMD